MRRTLIICAVLGLLGATCAAGCGGKDKDARIKVLARVSNKDITLKEFKERISKLPAYYQEMAKGNSKRFLDDMVVEMLFYEEAVRKGLERDKEVKEVINEARKKIIVAKLVKTEVEDKIKIDDAEALKFYEAHKADFRTPEMWRASHILVATEAEAKDVAAELAKGASFEGLAKARSMDATAGRGGDVGYFRRGQLVPDFEKACLKLNVSETSGIVHTQFGYHIIRLTAASEPAQEPLGKVRHAIDEELKKTKRSELFNQLVMDLKKKYNVTIEEDVFSSLESMKKEKP